MSIDQIKTAIMKLSPDELARFQEWLDVYCADMWDQQIEMDAKSGRLDKLIAEAEDEKRLIQERRNESERPLREYLKEKKR